MRRYGVFSLVVIALLAVISTSLSSCTRAKSLKSNELSDLASSEPPADKMAPAAASENSAESDGISKTAPAVVNIIPQGKDVQPDAKIKVTFNTEMNTSTISAIQVTKNGAEGMVADGKYTIIEGKWKDIGNKSFEFSPAAPLEPGSLVIVTIPLTVKSAGGLVFRQEKNRLSFLIDDGIHNGYENINIPTMKKENNGTHNIPMKLTVPKKGGPFPVMFWVHGGGWNGGTVNESEAEIGQQAQYLADHLGVAVAGVAYRCKGSNGTYAQALKDVLDAVEYCRMNSKTYNLDMSRIGFYGGSAGTPLGSLAAQKLSEAKLFIGYNGIYDFTNIGKGTWGHDNEKYISDPIANSPIINLRSSPPATLLLHGTKDNTVDPNQSVRFAEAVNKAGGVAKVLLYNGEVHSFFQPKKPAEIPTLYEVKEFIKKYLLK